MKDNSYYTNRSEMLPFLPDKISTFLDVGCGFGDFGAGIKALHQDCEVWGIEVIDEAAKNAEKVLDKVITGDALTVIDKLPNNHFNCICFNDSLEHMVDPYTLLNLIKTKLTEGGCVVASIPNVRYYKVLYGLIFKKNWRYRKSGVMDSTHLRFFTKKSIIRMFNEAGYTLEVIEPINKTKKVKVRIWAWLSLGQLNDILILQYACVAKPVN